MKKFLSVFVILSVLLSMFSVFGADYDGTWAKEDIDYLISFGIITPSGSGDVKPDEKMIRGEFVRMINGIYRFNRKATAAFSDVQQDNKYYEDFRTAKQYGYITGNEQGEVKPYDTITRAEVATILARIGKYEPGSKLYAESDVPLWAFGAVSALETACIMKGNENGEFMGYNNLTNAEAYTMGARILRNMGGWGASVHMVGDSTMANYQLEVKPQTGWGEVLQDYLFLKHKVNNRAYGGRSSKSFIDEGLWAKALANVKEGDYVIVQFGANDEKTSAPLYTEPQTTYKQYLTQYITDTRAKGATPILCTPNVRLYYKNEQINNTLAPYAAATLELAKELNVTCVDLNKAEVDFFGEIGEEGAKGYYLFVEPKKYPFYPRGAGDRSHFKEEGARWVAETFLKDILKTDSSFKDLIDVEKIPK